MQTFLPYEDFKLSAEALDMRRLGKQRVEVLQLIRGQFPHHPCSKMWWGHFFSLGEYGKAVCVAWVGRGYKDTCYEKICAEQEKYFDTGPPSWVGRVDVHRSHQSNLKRKDPGHYFQFNAVEDSLEYIWVPNSAEINSDRKEKPC